MGFRNSWTRKWSTWKAPLNSFVMRINICYSVKKRCSLSHLKHLLLLQLLDVVWSHLNQGFPFRNLNEVCIHEESNSGPFVTGLMGNALHCEYRVGFMFQDWFNSPVVGFYPPIVKYKPLRMCGKNIINYIEFYTLIVPL